METVIYWLWFTFMFNFIGVTIVMLIGLIIEYFLSDKIIKKAVYTQAYYGKSFRTWVLFCLMPIVGLAAVLQAFGGMLSFKFKARKAKKPE